MGTNAWPIEQRRYPRVHLGVPVRVQIAGEEEMQTLELANVSAGGGYFRTTNHLPRAGQRVAFGFVAADHLLCAARGRIVRVEAHGFAVTLDSANGAFQSFVNDLSGSFFVAA